MQCRFTSLDKNNAENETFFIFSAISLAVMDPTIDLHAVILLYIALGTRIMHSIMLVNNIQPFRTLSYLPCLLITAYFAIRTLAAAPR